ncbi:MAG: DUF1295 domain-containing protein [Burkholderiales bacterium]|nr:DUF1295 domain-containing protein [Burkholderiales bacterium]
MTNALLTGLMSLLCIVWAVQLARQRAPLRAWLFPVLPPLALVASHWLAGSPAAGFAALYLSSGLLLWGVLTLVWLASLAKRDSSIMDIFYSAIVVLVVWAICLNRGTWSAQEVLSLVLVSLWGGRLSLYLAWRNLPHGEDPRYARWRAKFGANWWWWSYFQVFLLQGVLVWLWTLPLHVALAVPGPVHWSHGPALVVFMVGFAFQGLGDWQLARFKADPANRGRVLDSGVWGLTRHPNYFGEALMWWAFWCMSLAHPWGWATIVMPLWVTWFMARDSATPMQERYLMKSKPGFAEYAARVPRFVPWTRP